MEHDPGDRGAECVRRLFDMTERLALTGDVIVSNTESNTYDQLGIPHLTNPWQA